MDVVTSLSAQNAVKRLCRIRKAIGFDNPYTGGDMKLRFKKHPRETGLAGVGYPYRPVDIKGDGKVVGTISAPSWQTDDNWRIRFMINNEDNWEWIQFKKVFESEAEAREFIKGNWQAIQDKYDLRQEISDE